MKQHITMAAILERHGRIFLLRPSPTAPWELPSGPLPPDNHDVDQEMDRILQRLGVQAHAIEEAFLQTHYIPTPDGQIVYNLYAPTHWTGQPTPSPGVGSGWFTLHELDAIPIHPHIHQAIREAYGLATPPDRTADILAALQAELTAAHPSTTQATLPRATPQLAHHISDFPLAPSTTDPALDPRTRSLLVIAMLAAQGHHGNPLHTHIEDALDHGATPQQIIETLRIVAIYAGVPAALQAWPAIEQALANRGIPRPTHPGATQ
ncbi:carboxymuconolactone decarboxylase family protein [Tepidiforma sp.]|uniref:carboxymuconolactone decarboxylase family protein n=1 Tax=Tepidiforma sp. TaxID=2682230 RepID=UPI002ADE4794|nr:carboxymuconolactone decarboxylase family protein [Tepidiforma sp.]